MTSRPVTDKQSLCHSGRLAKASSPLSARARAQRQHGARNARQFHARRDGRTRVGDNRSVGLFISDVGVVYYNIIYIYICLVGLLVCLSELVWLLERYNILLLFIYTSWVGCLLE